MYKEKNISKLLKNKIPIPIFFHSGICDGYHFAINNYISGITLRELLLKNNTNNIDDIMYQVGKILWDIANMLRYSFKTPKNFKASFINGLTDNNILLPSDWNKSIKLLNLISLIDLLIRTNAKNQPKRYDDIVLLINNIISY